MIGLGAIPTFVSLLIKPNSLFAVIQDGQFADWIRKKDEGTLALYGAGLLTAFFLMKNSYIAGLIYGETRLAANITAHLSKRLFQGYLDRTYTFHLQRNPAELVRNITEEAVRSVDFLKAGVRLLREGLVIGVILSLLLFFDRLITVSVFTLFAAASGVFYLMVRRSLVIHGQLSLDHWGRQVQIINQALGAIKDIKLLGREAHLKSLLGHEVDSLHQHESHYLFMNALPRIFFEVLAVVALVIVGAVYVVFGRPVQTMLPLLALFGVAVIRLVPSITSINTSLTDFRYKRPAFDFVCAELEAVENLDVQQSSTKPSTAKPIKMQGMIRLEEVRYRYPGAASEALQGISAEINLGEAIAFIGVSGSGKSTLIDVLLGLIEPTYGCVCVDGTDIRENLPFWQRQIGYVPQDIYLLDNSIRRNIAFGLADEDIDEAALTRAVEAAQLDKFVRSLPDGLSTPVGNRGIRLSGGQRQRIGIARALYHDPSVLVMDEATNALDDEMEREVVEAISRLRRGRTIVMIAHRLTTVRSCDRLYLLEEGIVKDQGSLEELMIRHKTLISSVVRSSEHMVER